MNLSKLKKLEAKATPGEWIPSDMSDRDKPRLGICAVTSTETLLLNDSDIQAVCELRNSAKEMISTIERYKAALEKIATEADKCGKLMEDNQPSQGDLRDMALEALKDPAPR